MLFLYSLYRAAAFLLAHSCVAAYAVLMCWVSAELGASPLWGLLAVPLAYSGLRAEGGIITEIMFRPLWFLRHPKPAKALPHPMRG